MYESKEEEGADEGVIFRRAGKPIGKYWFQLATLSDFKPGRDKCLCSTQTGTATHIPCTYTSACAGGQHASVAQPFLPVARFTIPTILYSRLVSQFVGCKMYSV